MSNKEHEKPKETLYQSVYHDKPVCDRFVQRESKPIYSKQIFDNFQRMGYYVPTGEVRKECHPF